MASLPRPKLLSLGFAVPPGYFTQDQALEMLGYTSSLSRRIFQNAGIGKRHFWVNPVGRSWQELCEEYEKGALDLSLQSAQKCLDGRDTKSVGLIVFCSVSGYTCPAMSYPIARDLGLPTDVVHTNIGGQGCQASVPGLHRAYDFAVVTGKTGLVLSTEICSASYFPSSEEDIENTVCNAIFGDASSAALVGYDDDPRHPEILDFESIYAPEHISLLGYKWVDGRLKAVLSKQVPVLVPPLIKQAVAALLNRNGLRVSDIEHWALHPGGKAVLENIEKELGLSREQTWASWEAMREFGNTSSATIGIIGKKVQKEGDKKGHIVAVSMGAGTGIEAALLRYGDGNS